MIIKKHSGFSKPGSANKTLKKLLNYGIFIILIFLFLSFVRSVNRVQKATEEISEVQKRVDNLKKENEDMERKLTEESTDEFMEKQLRDKLNMVKEGEIVVILPDPEIVRSYAPKTEEEQMNLPDPNWKKWLKLFGVQI